MLNLEKAIILATQAHRGQVDLGGEPYVLHPLRVMQQMHQEDARIVGVLHDAFEDDAMHCINFVDFEACKPAEHVLEALQLLTRQKGACYKEYIARILDNPLATAVKIADLMDNGDPFRLALVARRQGADVASDLARKYSKVLAFVLPHIQAGEAEFVDYLAPERLAGIGELLRGRLAGGGG